MLGIGGGGGAHALANATGRTSYDSMYVALAVRLNTRLITADDRLGAALKGIQPRATHPQHAPRHFR